MVEICCPIILP